MLQSIDPSRKDLDMTSTLTAGRSKGRTSPALPEDALVGAAAATYVGAWLAGLLVLTAQLPAGADASTVQAYYTEHAAAVALQATLVHAVAGGALAVLARGLAIRTRAARWRRTILWSGTAAAVLSLAQALLAYVAVGRASTAPAASSAALLHAINAADVVKLLLIAVFVAGVATVGRQDGSPRWTVGLGYVLALLLPLGAAAFVVDVPVLGGALVASLAVLLVWVGAVGVFSARRPRAAARQDVS